MWRLWEVDGVGEHSAWNGQAVHVVHSKTCSRGTQSLARTITRIFWRQGWVSESLWNSALLSTPGYQEVPLVVPYSSHIPEGKKSYSQSSSVWDKENQVNNTQGNWALGNKMALLHDRHIPGPMLGLLWWGQLHMTAVSQQFEVYKAVMLAKGKSRTTYAFSTFHMEYKCIRPAG